MHYLYQKLSTKTNERSDNDIYLHTSILNQTLTSHNNYDKFVQCGIHCNNNEEHDNVACVDYNFTAKNDGDLTCMSLAS